MIAVNNPNRSDSNTRNINIIVVVAGLNLPQSVTHKHRHMQPQAHANTCHTNESTAKWPQVLWQQNYKHIISSIYAVNINWTKQNLF